MKRNDFFIIFICSSSFSSILCKFSVISTCANSGTERCAYALFKADVGQVSGTAASSLVPNNGQVATAHGDFYFGSYYSVWAELVLYNKIYEWIINSCLFLAIAYYT